MKMRKLLLSTLFVYSSFLTFAQLKSVDLETYIIPQSTVVEYGETLSFEFGFINHGPDVIVEADTFIFVLPHLGVGNQNSMISIFTNIQVGDTFISDAEAYFDYENLSEADTMMAFCVEVRGLDGITNQGRPMTPTFEDPVAGNNVFCAEPILLKGKGASSTIARAKKQDLTIYPNPVQDRLGIQIDNTPRPDARFELVTLAGRTLFHGVVSALSSHGLDVSNFPSGVYFIKIQDREVMYMQKFVKK